MLYRNSIEIDRNPLQSQNHTEWQKSAEDLLHNCNGLKCLTKLFWSCNEEPNSSQKSKQNPYIFTLVMGQMKFVV